MQRKERIMTNLGMKTNTDRDFKIKQAFSETILTQMIFLECFSSREIHSLGREEDSNLSLFLMICLEGHK